MPPKVTVLPTPLVTITAGGLEPTRRYEVKKGEDKHVYVGRR